MNDYDSSSETDEEEQQKQMEDKKERQIKRHQLECENKANELWNSIMLPFLDKCHLNINENNLRLDFMDLIVANHE